MTDLELTRLCAERMGIRPLEVAGMPPEYTENRRRAWCLCVAGLKG